MNIGEFAHLRTVTSVPSRVYLDDLKDKSDRTLIHGYTCGRHTYHLYLKDGLFYSLYYEYDKTYLKNDVFVGGSIELSHCYPDKRIYPECCDLEFCEFLIKNGHSLPFTSFSENRELKQYYGELLEDLTLRTPITHAEFYEKRTHCFECQRKVKYTPVIQTICGEYDYTDSVNEYQCSCGKQDLVKMLVSEVVAKRLKELRSIK